MNLDEKIKGLEKDLEEKRSTFNNLVVESRSAVEADDLDTAKSKKEDAEKAKRNYKAAEKELNDLKELRSLNPIDGGGDPEDRGKRVNFLGGIGDEHDKEEVNKRYKPVFLKMIRGQELDSSEQEVFKEKRDFEGVSGLTPQSGGLVIPQDIMTSINQFKEQRETLKQYVNVQNVSTRSGSRVIEKRSTMTPFEKVLETGVIPNTDHPELEAATYQISDYAGILPVSNTALQDSDQNLQAYLVEWIGRKSIVTDNAQILEQVTSVTPTEMAGIDDIKTALNVTLDPAFAPTTVIYTNQDGFNYLDLLKDSDGRYLLQRDPTDPTKRVIGGTRVITLSNKTLASTDAKAPIIIGDLHDGVNFWDRQQMSLAFNPYSDTAFTTNTTQMRAIQRQDVRLWDDQAFILGSLELGTAPQATPTSAKSK